MNLEFNNLQELKDRITPAINTKLKELKTKNFNIITKEDIWNYLIEKKWKKSKDLTLYDIINDILNLDDNEIEEYAIKRSEQNDKNESRP